MISLCWSCEREIARTIDDRLVAECRDPQTIYWCAGCDERECADNVRPQVEAWLRHRDTPRLR